MASLLSIPEIIGSLDAWGYQPPVTEAQLQRPTPELVESILCACLGQVTGIQRQDLLQSAQDIISSLDDKDLAKDVYLTSLTRNLLFYHFSRLASAARAPELSILDLAKPTRDRTHTLLASVINFVKFTEQLCDPFVQGVERRSESLLAERNQVNGDLNSISKQIQEIEAKIAEDEPLCQDLKAKNQSLGSQLLKKKELKAAREQEHERLKAERADLANRKTTFFNEVDAMVNANKVTRSRIVQSPERIKRSISTMNGSLLEYKKIIAANETKGRELHAKINSLITIEQDVRSCIDQLQVVEKEIKSLQEWQKDLAELKDQLDNKNIEQNELQLRQERVAKQLENAHAKLASTQQRAAEKKAANARNIEKLQSQYDEMDDERKQNEENVAKVRQDAADVEKEMSEHLKASEEELNSLLKEYWGLRRQTEVYMETLANKLNMKIS